ncbi:MAG: hypothetical protein GY717_09100 [Rhodobacteraceae bacterium]|nr:hypothetical protein [Paracoccaceae bacterium]
MTMLTFSRENMNEEVEMIRRLQQEARGIPDAQWASWVNRNRDSIRLSGNDGYVPDRDEWMKRCESFLVCMGNPPMMAAEKRT